MFYDYSISFIYRTYIRKNKLNQPFSKKRMTFFHSLTDIPDTFGELAKKVLHTLPQRAPVHFITDTHKPDSIKSFERDRRGRPNDIFLLKGPAMEIPSNWKAFLARDTNNKTLTQFLLFEIQKGVYALIY